VAPDRPIVDLLDREFSPQSLMDLGGGGLHGAVPWRLWNRALYAPLRDFLERPGKEFRGEILALFFKTSGTPESPPLELPVVVEALHAGSLIVDDIEDGSHERRGRPALHREYGTAVALNAGNWLYFWALRLLEQIGLDRHTEAVAKRLATRTLLECHHGQALDLSVSASELAQHELPGVVRAISELKTGALVGFAAGLGALAGGASTPLVDAAIRAGRDFGTALQMLDDLGGIVEPRRRHKGREDLSLDRPTWVWAWLSASLEPARFDALRARGRAASTVGELEALEAELTPLVAVEGAGFVRGFLESSLERFRAAGPPGEVLAGLRRETERLCKSYG
jgi:geranylgeranyl pyrophosphate synthase